MMNCKSVKTDELFQEIKLGGISLFGALAGVQLETLWDYLEVRRYSAGQHIFHQGDLPNSIFVVISGKVDFIVEKEGVLRIESCYNAGDTFGESAYLGIQPYVGTAQVRSTGPVELMVLTRDALLEMHTRDQSLFALLMMNLAREVSRKYQASVSSN